MAIGAVGAGGNNPALKESLYDKLLLTGYRKTPILTKLGTFKYDGITHSWVTDALSTPSRTPKLELSDFADNAVDGKQKTTNATEIFTTEVMITKSMQSTAVVGGSEEKNQLAKKAIEHQQKLEMAILGLGVGATPKASMLANYVQRGNAVAGKMAGVFNLLAKTDANFANGRRGNIIAFDALGNWSDYNAQTNDYTKLTWDVLNEILQVVYDAGEDPKDIFLGSKLKGAINALVTRMYGNDKKATDAITTLDTDFGVINLNMHPFFNATNGLDNAIFAGNFDYLQFGLKHSTEVEEVPTSQTAKAYRYYTEATLRMSNANAFVGAVGLKA